MRTITSAADIDRLFNSGRRTSSRALVVLVASTPEARAQDGRVLFVAGKKLGSAVFRNRCKRVLRAAVQRCGGPWVGLDVALVSRQGTAVASPGDIDAVLRSALPGSGDPA